jgi:hypothetical protein
VKNPELSGREGRREGEGTREGGEMEFSERAAIRIKHWMEHNESHRKDYETFATQLEEARASRSAAHIREMAELTRRIDDCLQEALGALDGSEA